jgi:hypothetical protein
MNYLKVHRRRGRQKKRICSKHLIMSYMRSAGGHLSASDGTRLILRRLIPTIYIRLNITNVSSSN